jgi:hypothetical protein
MSKADEKDTKQTLDPHVAKLVQSIGAVIDPTIEDAPEPAVTLPAETITDIAERQKIAVKPEPKEEPKTEPEPPKAPETPPVKVEEPPKEEPKADPLPVRRKPQPAPEPPKPVEPPTPKPEPKEEPKGIITPEDEEYVKSLTPEQQDEIELARYAEEKKGKKGLVGELVSYFRKVDKYIAENNPDESDVSTFAKENRPKWNPTERRRVERDMIAEQAVAKAREEFQPEVNRAQRKIREMELKPVEEKLAKLFEDTLSKPMKLGETVIEPVDTEVIRKLETEGYEAAEKAYPTEAPVIAESRKATAAWVRIANGVEDFKPNDSTHAWLAMFLAQQGQAYQRMPKEIQIRDGRQFLPVHEFSAALQQDPMGARARYWTFNDEDVVDLIAGHAQRTIQQQNDQLRAAGWERAPKKVSGTTVTTPPAPVKETPPEPLGGGNSPRAAASGLPGASDGDKGVSEHDAWFNKIVPGVKLSSAGK